MPRARYSAYHVFLLPLAVVALVAAHVLLVRKHGIVPPLRLSDRVSASGSRAETSSAGARVSRSPGGEPEPGPATQDAS